MSTLELQKTITKEVLAIEDEKVLEQILEFLQKKSNEVKTKLKPLKPQSKKKTEKKINIGDPKHPYYDKLRPSEIQGIGEAMENYQKGEYVAFEVGEKLSIKSMKEKFVQKFGKDW